MKIWRHKKSLDHNENITMIYTSTKHLLLLKRYDISRSYFKNGVICVCKLVNICDILYREWKYENTVSLYFYSEISHELGGIKCWIYTFLRHYFYCVIFVTRTYQDNMGVSLFVPYLIGHGEYVVSVTIYHFDSRTQTPQTDLTFCLWHSWHPAYRRLQFLLYIEQKYSW